ncbi:MAG: hypothetical protein AAGI12_00730 [Pseudomonadota bacterium]
MFYYYVNAARSHVAPIVVSAVLVSCATLAISAPALATAAPTQLAQSGPSTDKAADKDPAIVVEPSGDAATTKADKKPEFELAKTLDGLLTQLSRTSDRRRAKRVEERIWEYWRESDSKSVDLLVGWARAAMRDKRFGQALDLLDQVVVLRPNYSEGWNQRATLHYMMSDFNKSIADIERTLALQPRHFGALSGLAAILERTGQKKRALDVWYRTLKVYPAMKSGQDAIVRLEEELAGSKL